jgi:serine/threonine protein phosphatase 1
LGKFVEWILGRPDERPGQAADSAPGQAADAATAPAGRRIYCVGDIHGRLDLLDELHGLILGDAASHDGDGCLVYLGDYIDRGPQSREVLDRLIEQPLDGFETVCLLGNHEQAMLDFLAHPNAAAGWLAFGGQATLSSYGIVPGRLGSTRDPVALRDELRECLPPKHLEFLESLPCHHVEGDYCFVHAGIRPGVAMAEQRPEDLMWIREEFTASSARHEHVVVHGHSITDEVEWRPNRIGIDTGAFYSGLLTALVLEGTQRRLLQTGRAQ